MVNAQAMQMPGSVENAEIGPAALDQAQAMFGETLGKFSPARAFVVSPRQRSQQSSSA